MKVIIAGGRDFNNYQLLVKECDTILKQYLDIEIVSGNAKGADKLAIDYAIQNNYKLTKFNPDWNIFGKSAGPIRNKQMAEYADTLIAFWDKKSKGTKNMLDTATKLNLKVYVFYY